MSLLHKKEGVKALRPRLHASASGGVTASRPQQVEKASPCMTECLAGTDIRAVMGLLANRDKFGFSDEQAIERAFATIAESNPFPATTGRICPHQCEHNCTRGAKDGPVAVGAIERFIGDFAIERGLLLPCDSAVAKHSEKIAIIGAGPAGLSCAYQLARRGYASTILESMPEPGGMLRYGIPFHRLPARVLKAEVQRILDLGIELRVNTRVGRDVGLDELRRCFDAVFIAPGAGASRQSIPGVEGKSVYQALAFLRDVASGQPPQLGPNVIVVGGGNTAIDVARTCVRLLGPDGDITLLRRRNPGIARELQQAIDEGVHVELAGNIASVLRDASGNLVRVVAERLNPEAVDCNGRSILLPIPGSQFELAADAIIVALGQQPNLFGLPGGGAECSDADGPGQTNVSRVWRGGDAVTPTLAAVVIAQGHQVALSIDAELRSLQPSEPASPTRLDPSRIKLDCYEPRAPIERHLAPLPERLSGLQTEVELSYDRGEAFVEAGRCLSCGSCFGCERCWMFCTPGCMTRLPVVSPGHHFAIELEKCDGCRKCAEQCPSGFLDMS